MSKVHISIDIETLGNTSYAPITQIGAVAFRDGEIEGEFEAAIQPKWYDNAAVKPLFKIDADTMMWWMSQSRDAQLAAFSGTTDLFTALLGFRTWCWDCKADSKVRIWAKPPQFDCTIIRNGYKALQVLDPNFDGQPGWSHWEERCLRTLIEVFPRIKRMERQGTHHNALDDARHQARQIMAGLQLKKELYGNR